MRRLLGRAALAGAVALLALGPATVSRADEPVPTSTTAQPGSATSSTDQAERDKILAEVRAELAESSEQMVLAAADLRLTDQALPGARATVKRTQQLLAEAQRRQEQTALRRGRGPGPLHPEHRGGRGDRRPGRRAAGPDRPAGPRGLPGRRLAGQRLHAAGRAVPVGLRRAAGVPADGGVLAALGPGRPRHRAGVVRPADRRPRAGPRRLRGSRRAGPGGPAAGDRPGRAGRGRGDPGELPGRHPQGGSRGRRSSPGRGRRGARPPGRGVDPAAGSARGRGPRRAGSGRQHRRSLRARRGRARCRGRSRGRSPRRSACGCTR